MPNQPARYSTPTSIGGSAESSGPSSQASTSGGPEIPNTSPSTGSGGLARSSPTVSIGNATAQPASGPAAAMSNSALRSGIAPRIRITAPNVPNGGGPGMK